MSNIREFIRQNRSKKGDSQTSGEFVDFGNTLNKDGGLSLQTIIKGAKTSGSLILSNRKLTSIPLEVYDINNEKPKTKETISFDSSDNTAWWDEQFLTKLILNSNLIETVSNCISNLKNLVYLDISDNKITEFNNNICLLTQLKFLNIERNKIKSIPDEIGNLINLQQFKCSSNQIYLIPSTIRNLSNLQLIEFNNNQLQVFPNEIGYLINLISLNFSHNKISEIKVDLNELKNLKTVDLSHNQLKELSNNFNAPVSNLNLNVNQLTKFPINFVNKNLTELQLSHNRLYMLTEKNLECIPSILTLTLSYNKISKLPDNISLLIPNLCNFDISNNELTSLPSCLGSMESLIGLFVDGNAFRTIKRTVIESGTEGVKRHLRIREEIPISNNSTNNNSVVSCQSGIIGSSSNKLLVQLFPNKSIDEVELNRTGIVRLDCSNLIEFNQDMALCLNDVAEKHVKAVLLHKNKLTVFPIDSFILLTKFLSEINVSYNSIKEIPESISKLYNLHRLDISYNQLKYLPNSLVQLSKLEYLNVSNNDLGNIIPQVIFELKLNLRQLLVSHCGITQLNAAPFQQMTLLDTLDLSNNDITNIPPELGLCESIKTLNLEGNSFRVPRPNILARGTEHIMEYLRSRIVQ